MPSELFKLIFIKKTQKDLLNEEINSYRIVCLIGAFLIPAFWIVHKTTNPNIVDSLEIRIFLSLLFLMVFFSSYINEHTKKNMFIYMECLYYIISFWIIYLNFINKFADYFMVLMGFPLGVMTLGIKRRFQLIAYPLTILFLTILASLLVTEAEINVKILISNIATILLISYIVSVSRLNSQEENSIREKFMTSIFNESADALFLLDPHNKKVIDLNRTAKRIFNLSKVEKLIESIFDIGKTNSTEEDISGTIIKIDSDYIFLKKNELQDKEDKTIWIDFVIKEIKIVGETILLVRISDISERKQAEEALQQAKDELEKRVEERTAELLQSNLLLKQEIGDRQRAEEQLIYGAFHDALTGLPNRALFVERLGQAVERAKCYKGYLFAVLFLDLDRFKVVNDSLGHMAGDQLLLAIAKRIKACLRVQDLVARIGGDEFTILLEGIRDVNEAKGVASRIQEQLKLPFNLSGNEVFTSASIGIALSVAGYEKPEQILRDADMAMYKAKMCGKARHEVFNITMHSAAVARLQMETDLRRAIERQEFRLHYQPIISLDSGTINGFEALVRWQHPEHGLVSPAEFIPLAEETGLIVPLGWWVIREACSQMQVWQAQFLANPLTISVNISGRQFSELDLSQRIEQILQEYRLDPRTLKLEITESAIVENAESATVMLAQLRKLGIQLCMDDFGTGYSSLSYLHRFPIDMLKIDRSFVSRMSFDNEDSEIVRTIVTLAHNLGMNVTAEGVETAEQVDLLKEINCEYGQGYFFSKPIDSKAATALILRLGIG